MFGGFSGGNLSWETLRGNKSRSFLWGIFRVGIIIFHGKCSGRNVPEGTDHPGIFHGINLFRGMSGGLFDMGVRISKSLRVAVTI